MYLFGLDKVMYEPLKLCANLAVAPLYLVVIHLGPRAAAIAVEVTISNIGYLI
jgi:hypothetical protein